MRFLFSLFALVAWNATSVAQLSEGEGWALDSDGSPFGLTLTISSEEGFSGVSDSKSYAENNSMDVSSVVIAEGVESIPEGAFKEFGGLANSWSVTLPASLTFIGDEAFDGCATLVKVNINSNDGETHVIYLGKDENGAKNTDPKATGKDIFPTGVTLSYNPLNTYIGDKGTQENLRGYFSNFPGYYYDKTDGRLVIYDEKGLNGLPSSAKTVTFTSDCGIKSIPGGTFYSFSNLTEVKGMPADLESIGEYAFSNCTALEAIDLSGCTALTSIGQYAFNNCTALEAIDLSGYTALTSIGEYAFVNCEAFKSVKLSAAGLTAIGYVFGGCSNLTYADLSECTGLKEMRKTFSSCKKLKTVILPKGLTTINNNTFSNCNELDSVILLSNSVPSIGNGAFYNVSDLPVLYYNEAITDISSIAKFFSGAVAIGCGEGYYYIPSAEGSTTGTLTILSSAAFGNISGYKDKAAKVVFAPGCGVTSIPEKAFYQFSMTEVTGIPAELGEIGKEAFSECKSLKSIDLSGCVGLSTIGKGAFYNCGSLSLESAEMPATLSSIGGSAFELCNLLTSIDLSKCSNLKEISESAFNNCQSLKSVKLPISLTSIADYAFFFCSLGLTDIDLSECTKLEEIGESAFTMCYSLETVELPASLTYIGDLAFSECTKLKNVYINSNNDGKMHVIYLGKDEIGDKNTDPKATGNGVFSSNDGMTLHYNPLNTYIGDEDTQENLRGYFSNFPGYYYDETDGRLVVYADEGFANADSYRSAAKSLTVIDPVTRVPTEAFYNSSNIESVTLPASLTTIDPYAFDSCSNLTAVDFSQCGSLAVIDNYAFSKTKLTSVDLGESSKLVFIGQGVFQNAIYLEDVTLPDNLETLDDRAFNGCFGLSKINIPAKIKLIGAWMFSECEYTQNLKELTLPATLLNIGDSAFKQFVNLETVTIESDNTIHSSGDPHIIILGNSTNGKAATGVDVFSENLKTDGAKLYYNTENTYIGDAETENIRSYFDNGKINYVPTSLQVPTTTSEAQYYDLNGRKVSTPVHQGVTVRRQDGKSSLIIVK